MTPPTSLRVLGLIAPGASLKLVTVAASEEVQLSLTISQIQQRRGLTVLRLHIPRLGANRGLLWLHGHSHLLAHGATAAGFVTSTVLNLQR